MKKKKKRKNLEINTIYKEFIENTLKTSLAKEDEIFWTPEFKKKLNLPYSTDLQA